jgi:DNA-binding transcriptional ArsR family regulator
LQPSRTHATTVRPLRAIFERLLAGPEPVGKLAGTLPVSRRAVSQHLTLLKETGVVSDREDAKPTRLDMS